MKIARLSALLLLISTVALGQTAFPVGNLNPPVPPAATGIHESQVSYAYLIYPPDQGSCELGGFMLDKVHMYLAFQANQVPIDFQARAGLREAIWDNNLGAYVPGPLLCTGPLTTFHIDVAGQYVIDLPLDGTCGCHPFDAHYFLTVEYPTLFVADLPIDGLPQANIVYRDTGGGWTDMILLSKTAGGKVIIWGDLICCEPVGNETATWGGIKALYE